MKMTTPNEVTAGGDTDQRWNVKDGQRSVTFVGQLVASADSQSGTDVRWTELSLYRTSTGRYILEKIGRSDVFHSELCKRRSKGLSFTDLHAAAEAQSRDQDVTTSYIACTDCRPDFEVRPAWVEQDISSVAVYENVPVMIDAMYRRDADSAHFMSRVSRMLLDNASRKDPSISTVLNTPSDVT